MGVMATEMLVERIHAWDRAPRTVMLDIELVVRGSTASMERGGG